MYKAIFFDIDDTLLDFNEASYSAFYKSFEMLNLPIDDVGYQKFQAIDHDLWQAQRLGKITVNDVIDLRFQQLFSALKIQSDSAKMRDIFQTNLSLESTTINGAHDILEYLNKKYQLYTASNGIFSMQESRLQKANLLHYFSDLFISNMIDYEKPDPRFFKYCLAQSQLLPEEILFVGDSLTADIFGASNYGIDTCWYNPKNLMGQLDCNIKYMVNSLLELRKIL